MPEVIMGAGVQLLAISLLLAWLVEAFMEIFVDPWLKLILNGQPAESKWRAIVSNLKPYISSAAGIGLAFALGLDLLGYAAELFGLVINPIVGTVLTGLIIGRGGSFVHDFWKHLRGPEAPPD